MAFRTRFNTGTTASDLWTSGTAFRGANTTYPPARSTRSRTCWSLNPHFLQISASTSLVYRATSTLSPHLDKGLNIGSSQVHGTRGRQPLHGLTQSIGRAELSAIIAAAQWTLEFDCDTRLWSDSQSTILGAQKLIAGDQTFLAKNPGNFDLWDMLWEITQQLRPLQFQIAWTPSHINQASCQDSLEEWRAAWNDNADLNAGFMNQQRPAELVGLLRQDSEYYSYWSKALRLFRRFLLEVADIRSLEVSVFDATPTIDDFDWGEKMHQLTIGEALPGNWKELLFATGSGSKILLAVQLCEQVTQLESGSADL